MKQQEEGPKFRRTDKKGQKVQVSTGKDSDPGNKNKKNKSNQETNMSSKT